MTPSLEGECLTPGTLEALGFGALICEYLHLPLDRIDHLLLNPGLDHAKSPQDPVGNSGSAVCSNGTTHWPISAADTCSETPMTIRTEA